VRPVNAHFQTFQSNIMKIKAHTKSIEKQSTKWYETHYITELKNKRMYRTKSLIKEHKDIHELNFVTYARTIECDSAVQTPFGLWSEVIAITDKKNPNKNQTFK